jgi:flagellar basal-body rod protein FlgB
MWGSVNSVSVDVGAKSLDALWERSNVISNNIANADTPGYTEQTVSFEDQLSSALSDGTLSESELANINPVVTSEAGSGSPDGSGVDMEQQMVDMMRNQLQYNYVERGVSDELANLTTAASEGRK